MPQQHLPPHLDSSDGLEDAEAEWMDMPVHPLPSLQSAFEESIRDSTEEHQVPAALADARLRRQHILESASFDDSWTTRWNQRPTARCHPLLKLISQIVYGLHLLEQQTAKNNRDVVEILQTHVNEFDSFLERTAEDLDLAIHDIKERIQHLAVPMTHMETFESMLDDTKFRTQLLASNDQIAKILDRSTRAMNASLLDMDKGVQAIRELHRYMKHIHHRWPQHQRSIGNVLEAMRGNEQGWKRYLRDLHHKASTLAANLAQLGKLVGEMSRMTAAASRRNNVQSTSAIQEYSPSPRSKFSIELARPMPAADSPQPSASSRRVSNVSDLNKPLPIEPKVILNGTQNARSKPHAVPFAERYERPRQSPREPALAPRTSIDPITVRPKTAGAATKQARAADARVNPSALLSFFQRPDPLGSNPHGLKRIPSPPGSSRSLSNSNPPRSPFINNPNPLRSNPVLQSSPTDISNEYKLNRSQSHGTNVIMGTVSVPAGAKEAKPKMTRSRSQGALDILTPVPPAAAGDDSPDGEHSQSAVMQQQQRQNSITGHNTTTTNATTQLGTNEHEDANSGMEDNAQRRAAMTNTGFARRLSKRLKHLPLTIDPSTTTRPPTTATAASDLASPTRTTTTTPIKPHAPSPSDSAYASLRDKPSPPNGLQSPTFPAEETEKAARPESVIGPLAGFGSYQSSSSSYGYQRPQTQPTAQGPYGAGMQEGTGSDSHAVVVAAAAAAAAGGSATSVRSLASGKSRTLSFKGTFRGRWGRRGKGPSVPAAAAG